MCRSSNENNFPMQYRRQLSKSEDQTVSTLYVPTPDPLVFRLSAFHNTLILCQPSDVLVTELHIDLHCSPVLQDEL